MSSSTTLGAGLPRMWCWALLIPLLMLATLVAQSLLPGVLAVTMYKAHLMALGGWGGYWLDRSLFPYARPHDARADLQPIAQRAASPPDWKWVDECGCGAWQYELVMLRRALVVLGCLLCVGLAGCAGQPGATGELRA